MPTKKNNEAIRRYMSEAQYRSFTVDRAAINEEKRTVELAFSSEAPVERFIDWDIGMEVLDHSPGSVRLDRIRSGGAVLLNHSTDKQLGVVEDVSVDADRRGRAVIRFGESDLAQEIFHDVATGIRKNVSVGYMVHEMVLEKENKDSPSVYRVMDWEPLEISIVPVPADVGVGVGRNLEKKEINRKEREMPDKKTETAVPSVDVKAVEVDARNKARESEIERIREITEIGEKYGHAELARKCVQENKTTDEMRAAVLERMGEIKRVDTEPEIGMTDKEIRSYSWLRAINALASPGDARAREAAAFEFECSDVASKKMGRSAQGLFVPNDVLTRDMTVGTDADGGYLKGTDHLGGSFIDRLTNRLMVKQMGAVEMTGLIGDVAIPAMTAGHTHYWVAESGAVTESKPTMGQKTMAPHTVGAMDDISRKLIKQSSPGAEMLVQNDIIRTLALGIDLAALHGTGSSGQPTGLAAVSGIGSVDGGAAGATPTWAHIVSLETEVAQDNADVGAVGYLTNTKVRGTLRQVFKNSTGGDTPVWADGNQPGFGMLNGYKAGVTNQVSSTLDRGDGTLSASAIFFGNWADLVIGMWGGLDLTVDPYTASSTGTVRVVGLQDIDIMVRRAESFAAMLDALTA